MTARESAVDRVMGRILLRPEKPRGSLTSSRTSASSRLQRAGARDGPAVFKTVRNAGATSREGLKGQLNYIFQAEKVYSIIDSRGRFERFDAPDNNALNQLTREWSNDWWKSTPKLGHTSHLIFSFPKGVSHEKVEAITRDVLGEMLEGRGRDSAPSYKYVAAVHHDRDHPHAHVVVNRRGSDGQLLTMRRGAELSYEGFRESMARHADRYGVRLDPTFRYERGIARKQPSLIEQIMARKGNRAAEQRPLTERDRIEIDTPVKYTQIAYSALAVVAQNADAERLALHYERLSDLIDTTRSDVTSERITPMQDLSDSEVEVFDRYLQLATEKMVEAERAIAEKPASERVAAEIELADIMADLTRLNPEHPYARDLHEPPSINSIYSAERGERADALRSPEAVRAIEGVARDYGLDAPTIIARMEHDPGTKYTEQVWAVDDMQRMLDARLIEVHTKDELIAKLGEAYDRLRDELEPLRVLAEPDDLERDEPERGQPLTEAERDARDMIDSLARDHLAESGDLAQNYQTREALMIRLSRALPPEDYQRLRSGDPAAAERLTDDPVTARAVAVEAIIHDRATGREITPEVQEREDTLVASIREATGLAERDREDERQRRDAERER